MNLTLIRPSFHSGAVPLRAAALLLGAGLGLSACASDTSRDAAAPSVSGAGSAVTTVTAATTSAGSSVNSTYSVELPDGVVAGTAEAAAWEALMGTDGEYAAFAMYGAVIDEFGSVEPYATIQQQEGRHIDALVRQLDRMQIEVPVNPYLGAVEAPADLQQAAQNWADGEVVNVAMYDDLMVDAADDPQLTRVFTNLRRASQEHHLPMFAAAAAAGGTLDQAAMGTFADEHEHEHGSGGMHGNGEMDGDGQHSGGHQDDNGPNIVDE